jgi:hypothetical protein
VAELVRGGEVADLHPKIHTQPNTT